MIRRPPRSTQSRSSAASDVYKRQGVAAPGDVEALAEVAIQVGVGGCSVGESADPPALRAEVIGEGEEERLKRDRYGGDEEGGGHGPHRPSVGSRSGCLLYTSDAADDLL